MSQILFLDSGPLGLLTHPQRSEDVIAIAEWLSRALLSGSQVIVPAIVYYELKRELLRAKKTFGIGRFPSSDGRKILEHAISRYSKLTRSMHEEFMLEALTLARGAEVAGEVPVGAVVVIGGKIVGRGSNAIANTSSEPLARTNAVPSSANST